MSIFAGTTLYFLYTTYEYFLFLFIGHRILMVAMREFLIGPLRSLKHIRKFGFFDKLSNSGIRIGCGNSVGNCEHLSEHIIAF